MLHQCKAPTYLRTATYCPVPEEEEGGGGGGVPRFPVTQVAVSGSE